MATIGELAVNIVANTAGLARGIAVARTSLGSLAGVVGQAAGAMVRFAGPVALAAGAVLGLASAAEELSKSVQMAAAAEQTAVAFEVMVGSARGARDVIADLTQFADVTPFEPGEVIAAGRAFLAVQTPVGELIPMLKLVGNMASTAQAPFGELATTMAKMKAENRVMAEELNQLGGRGIPIVQALAAQFGVTEGEVRKMASAGKIGFGDMQSALAALFGEGGKFGGMMDKMSQTVLGRWGAMQGAIDGVRKKVGALILDGLDLGGIVEGVAVFFERLGRLLQNEDGSWTETAIELKEAFAAVGLAIGEAVSEIFSVENPMEAFRLAAKGVAFVFHQIAQLVELIKTSLLFSKSVAFTIANMFTAGHFDFLREGEKSSQQAFLDALMRQDVSTRVAGTGRAGADLGGGVAAEVKSTLASATGQAAADAAAMKRRAEAHQEILKEGAKLTERMRTPTQKFWAEIRRLGVQFDHGAISIGTYHRAFIAARRELDEHLRRQREADPRFKAAREREESLRDRAKEITESTRTPLETFKAEIAELFELDRRGLLSPEAFARRRKEIFESARSGLPEPEPTRFAGAALAGSQEAFSAILRAGAQDPAMAERKRQTGLLVMMERHLVEFLKRRPATLAAFPTGPGGA